MTLEEFKAQIDGRQFLTEAKHGGYICPYCGSGSGKNGTGAMKYYPEQNNAHCHKCGANADSIDLYAKATGHNATKDPTSYDFKAVVYEIAANYHIEPPTEPNKAPHSDFNAASDKRPTKEENAIQSHTDANTAAFIEYYKSCAERLKTSPDAAEYLASRCISLETAEKFNIGYDPQSDPAGSGTPTPRIIIPVSNSYFVGRSIDPNTPKQFKAMNPKGQHIQLFNFGALYNPGTVFITEGIFDALSIIEAAAKLQREDITAVALNSATNKGKLITQIRAEAKQIKAQIVLALDYDSAGRDAQKDIKTELEALGIDHAEADLTADIKDGSGAQPKDPNDALKANPAAFIKAVEAAAKAAADAEQGADKDTTLYYLKDRCGGLMLEISEFIQNGETPTGYSNLDAEIGSLYPGLYVVGAVASLGKTTFCLQLADQLAESGKPVIIFSLEQSKLELITKSFARLLKKEDINSTITSLDIRKGKAGESALTKAMQKYETACGDRINIIEGNNQTTIETIINYCKDYIIRRNARPVVIIDYLQIIPPTKEMQRSTLKEITDSALTQLRQLSRDHKLTVIAISSLNRTNYTTPIDYESFKESGGIEYTADAVFGLQYACICENKDFESDNKIAKKREAISKAKIANPRSINLVCLKNRYGHTFDNCFFKYYQAQDYFVPTDEQTDRPTNPIF